ncbi:MAG: InlB B-repeat-containing protein [Clostridia bacterium]
MKIIKKLITLTLCMGIATIFSSSAFALSWSGSTNIGSNNPGIATGGFSVPYTSESNLVGYRFSVIDSDKNTVVIQDYLRGSNSYMTTYGKVLVESSSHEVRNKYQLKSNYNGAYTTVTKTFETYSSLPSVGSIKTWVINNSDTLLKKMGLPNGTDDMYYGDRLLIEPLFMVVINNEKLTMTISDIVIVGSQVFGKTGNVYSQGWGDGTWGYLSNYTQKFFPNYLHTDSDSSLWSDLWGNAPTLSSIATFGTILDNGYGVGVAFQSYKDPIVEVTIKYWKYSFSSSSWTQFDTKYDSTTDVDSYTPSILSNPSYYTYNSWSYMGNNVFHVDYWQNRYTVSYNANNGTNAPNSQTKYGGVNLTLTSSVPTRSGYTFSQWNTKADGTGTSYYQGSSFTSNSNVTLYAQWKKNYTLDLNAYLNNTYYGGTYDWATVDVYVNGSLVANDVTDYYAYHPQGSTYEIKDIKMATGKMNNGQSSYSGTINSNVSVNLNLLSLHTQTLNFYKWKPDTNSWESYTSKSYTAAYGTTFTATTSGITTPTGYYFSHFNVPSWTVTGDYWTNGHYYPNEYTVSYNANGGTNAPSSQVKYYGVNLTISSQIPTRTGYIFKGWGTSSTDTTANYQPSSTYTSNSAITLYAIWQQVTDLYPEFNTPNATYYANTEIIASFDIVNNGAINFTQSNDVDVNLKVYSISQSNVSSLILNSTQSIVIPKYEENLVYWKISIPSSSKQLKYEITVSSSSEETNSSNNTQTYTVNVSSLVNSQTDDTIFEDTPIGFTVPNSNSNITGLSIDNNASWQVWEWVNNNFKQITYGIETSLSVTMEADTACKTELVNGSSITMKSGYGVQTKVNSAINSYSSYTMPSTEAYTEMQSANMYLPEYMYSTSIDKYRTLEQIGDSFYFERNENTMTESGVTDNRRTHFIPIYFPDETYAVKAYGYNLWTPAGMINTTSTNTQIEISGDIYDDWEITGR